MTSTRVIHPYRNKQLFLDDDAVEAKYGLRRTVNKPDRVGPVMRPDRSRGQVTLQRSTPPQTGEPVSGLSGSDCVPVHGDQLRGAVSWNRGADLAHHGPVRVRFTLEGARLYAFWLEG